VTTAATDGAATARAPRRRIGTVLVEQGLITADQLDDCLAEQATAPDPSRRPRLGRLVVEKGMATEQQVAGALARALGLPLIDLSAVVIDPDVARRLPRTVSERHGAAVINQVGTAITVAVSDPTNVVAQDDARLYTGATEVTVVVAVDSDIRALLSQIWNRTEDAEEFAADLTSAHQKANIGASDADLAAAEDVGTAPVVRLVEAVLGDAVRQRASDVHIEPQQGDVRIRVRVDGLLRDVMTVPHSAGPAIVSRMKIISGLDIAERRRPQDGRARLDVEGQHIDARVSTLPTMHGEKIVVRLLARDGDLKSLKDVGMEEDQLEELLAALRQPQGLVLITGPTGSGKTSTLYAGIHQIRSPELNIVTLEDPVEISLPGIVQVQINPRAGLTFSGGLRSVLRQDPDVVLVGEIRDGETASLALEASMTGHLVLSTLHTNDAVGAVTRLVELGVEPFLVGSSLALVIAQRLVRRPCDACAVRYEPTPRQRELLGLSEADLEGSQARRGPGCTRCAGTGYLGRIGVYEVLPVTARLRRVLLSDPSEAAVGAAARAAGLRSLRSRAIAKALRGETTFEEVLRATPVESSDDGSKRCPSCSLRQADSWLACPRCGHDSGAHCSACSQPLQDGWRVCPHCRTPAPERSVYAVSAPDAGPAAPALPRVLIVDTDPAVGAHLAGTLAGRVTITSACSGDEALRQLAADAYDAAVLDLALPDLPGLELVRLIRDDPRTATLPLLLFTGDRTPEIEARSAGADDWLAKPAPPQELEHRLLTLVRAAGAHTDVDTAEVDAA
jgi:type IV pilus assembly protein PilB